MKGFFCCFFFFFFFNFSDFQTFKNNDRVTLFALLCFGPALALMHNLICQS